VTPKIWMWQASVTCTLRAVSIRLITGLFSLFLLAQTAHAEEITPWSFTGNMPKDARVIQLTSAQITRSGLAINTQSDGFIVWSLKPLDGPVDVITVRARTNRTTKASMLWQPVGGTPDQLVQLYFEIPGTSAFEDVDIIVSGYPQWDWKTEQFAIALPAGSDVIIEELQFRHWPLYERIGERWKSFWTFDTFRPYSINFLWGPLISSNSPARDLLYATLPPTSPSVTRYFYVVLAIVAIGALVASLKPWRRQKAFGWFLAVFVLIWLIFDIRMGAEILSYAVRDVQTYVLPKPAKKELRNFRDIYARIDAMLPTLQEHDKIALLVPVREVYEPVLRYEAYPHVVVTDPAAMSGATAWVVMDRADMWVDDSGHLRQGNDTVTSRVVTGVGHVAVKIDENNFLFVTP